MALYTGTIILTIGMGGGVVAGCVGCGESGGGFVGAETVGFGFAPVL